MRPISRQFVFVFVETQRRNMKLDGQAGKIWEEIKEKKNTI